MLHPEKIARETFDQFSFRRANSSAWAALSHADEINLDQRVVDEETGRSSRRRGGKAFFRDLVEGGEVLQIGKEHLRLATNPSAIIEG